MYNILEAVHLLSLSMPVSGLHCVLVPYESALRAAEDRAKWEPEPCPLWIRTLCQSNPHRGLYKLSPSPLPYNTMPWLVAYLPTIL